MMSVWCEEWPVCYEVRSTLSFNVRLVSVGDDITLRDTHPIHVTARTIKRQNVKVMAQKRSYGTDKTTTETIYKGANII